MKEKNKNTVKIKVVVEIEEEKWGELVRFTETKNYSLGQAVSKIINEYFESKKRMIPL